MRLLLRVLLLISVMLLLSMVGVIGYFMQDPRVLLEQIEAYVEETHQVELQIEGVNISSWHQLPQLSVDLEEVSLRHPEDDFSVLYANTLGLELHVLDYVDFALRLDSFSLADEENVNASLDPSTPAIKKAGQSTGSLPSYDIK